MAFQKGNTLNTLRKDGNHKGRPPKGQSTAELLRALGELKYAGSDKTRRERAAEVVWEQACKGNLQAFLAIVERTEGKVPDKLDQSGRLTIRVIRE
jgi:hypothetical protein